jgi:hypothetical protein
MPLTFWEARFPFLIFCRKVYNSLASGVNRLSPDASVVVIEDTLLLNVENYPAIQVLVQVAMLQGNHEAPKTCTAKQQMRFPGQKHLLLVSSECGWHGHG